LQQRGNFGHQHYFTEETMDPSPASSAPDSYQKFASRIRRIQKKLTEIFAVDLKFEVFPQSVYIQCSPGYLKFFGIT
jgi:hypothetical protein